MKYEISITGSGTADEIEDALFWLAKAVGAHLTENTTKIVWKDKSICTEISSIEE